MEKYEVLYFTPKGNYGNKVRLWCDSSGIVESIDAGEEFWGTDPDYYWYEG